MLTIIESMRTAPLIWLGRRVIVLIIGSPGGVGWRTIIWGRLIDRKECWWGPRVWILKWKRQRLLEEWGGWNQSLCCCGWWDWGKELVTMCIACRRYCEAVLWEKNNTIIYKYIKELLCAIQANKESRPFVP